MLTTYYQNTATYLRFNHQRTPNPVAMDFHLHNEFEIYFFIAGNVRYFIEKNVYPLRSGDILLMNNHEIHRPTFGPGVYERMTLHFDPQLIRAVCPPGVNLLQCFTERSKGEGNQLNLQPSQVEKVYQLLEQIERVELQFGEAAPVLRLTYLIELLAYINKAFASVQPEPPEPVTVPEKLAPVLDYIDANLDGDLTLEALERQLYINRFHLSRVFKQYTGSSIHEYIVYKRISRAKKLLAEGFNVTEACQLAGFRDYSNFIRVFKKATGVAPGKYKRGN